MLIYANQCYVLFAELKPPKCICLYSAEVQQIHTSVITRQTGDGRTYAGSQGPGSGVYNTVGQTLARPAGHLASPSPFLWSTGNLCEEEERVRESGVLLDMNFDPLVTRR